MGDEPFRRSETTLTDLPTILQTAFAWSDEHRHGFRIHGRAYDSTDAETSHVCLADIRLHRGERFLYICNFMAYSACEMGLEAIPPLAPPHCYPVCIGGKRAAAPEDCRGAWAYMQHGPLTVGIDGGYVRAPRKPGWFLE